MELALLIVGVLMAAAIFLGLRNVAMGLGALAASTEGLASSLAKPEPEEEADPHSLSFEEKIDRLKDKVCAYLRSDDPLQWEKDNDWNWGDWELSGWSVAEMDREAKEKVPNLFDLPQDLQEELRKKRELVREQRKPIEEQEAADWERTENEKQQYIEQWLAKQPDEMLRQQYADGLLNENDAEDLIAASSLDALLGPSYEYQVCYRTARERLFNRYGGHGCGELKARNLPVDVYPAWHALKAKLPLGTEWTLIEVFPCLLNWGEGPSDKNSAVGERVYVAKLIVPVGPLRIERTVQLRSEQSKSVAAGAQQ